MIAAGERWPDGTLRPALEDSQGAGPLSPEATAARACFVDTDDIAGTVATCSSGRELIRTGFADDAALATDRDTSTTVPVLTAGAFTHSTDAPRRRRP